MSSKLPDHYRYTYKLTLFGGSWRHNYMVIGRWGGLNFHVADFGEERGSDRYSAGLEIHYRQPPEYMGDIPPHHDECWLLKQPCWHDGTSLYAQETVLNYFDGADHERMFRFLAREADERFEAFAIRNRAAREAQTTEQRP